METVNTIQSVTLHVVEALEKCGVPYVLVGAFSSNFYGIPRSTKDADFVLQMKGALGEDFIEALGGPYELDPQLTFETNTGTYRQNLRCKGNRFKIELFFLSTDKHDQERFKRRRQADLLGRTVWFPSPEDVVIQKLRWGRSKDKDDVRNVIMVQQAKLDWQYIEHWCKEHGSIQSLEEVRKSLSPM